LLRKKRKERIAVKETFDRLVGSAGIASVVKRRPRLHDLRHRVTSVTIAVTTSPR
jgi:hypothetical protein